MIAPPECPLCGGLVWDNRFNKKIEYTPDFRCQRCSAVVWLTGRNANIWQPSQPRKPDAR